MNRSSLPRVCCILVSIGLISTFTHGKLSQIKDGPTDVDRIFGSFMHTPPLKSSLVTAAYNKIVPKYMWNIYNQIADPKTGETKVFFPNNRTAKPFIESFTAKRGHRLSDAISLSFNASFGHLSPAGPNHLELAIKRKWKRLLSQTWAADIRLEIGIKINNDSSELLLHTTMIKTQKYSEYDVFDLSRIFRMKEVSMPTLQLVLRLRHNNGKVLPFNMIHFLYKLSPKNEFRPVLVLYHGISGHHELEDWAEKSSHRIRRSNTKAASDDTKAAATDSSSSSDCKLEPMFVSFADLGWSNQIIAPLEYDGKVCKGSCGYTFSLDNNHAKIQAVLQLLPSKKDIPPPCCGATSFLPLSVLYSGSDGNVVVRQWKNMIVEKCSCK